eukprot:gene695-1153_t
MHRDIKVQFRQESVCGLSAWSDFQEGILDCGSSDPAMAQ